MHWPPASGCVNGGGQLKLVGAAAGARESPAGTRTRVAAVDAVLHAGATVRRPEDSPLVRYLFGQPAAAAGAAVGGVSGGGGGGGGGGGFPGGAAGRPLGEGAMSLLHTRYHAVPKLELVTPLAAKW